MFAGVVSAAYGNAMHKAVWRRRAAVQAKKTDKAEYSKTYGHTGSALVILGLVLMAYGAVCLVVGLDVTHPW